MLSLSPRITSHRSLHVLRASLCEQYGKMRRRYRITKQLYFKGVCLGLHQSIKEIDALLDDGPTVLANDRDWADARENTRLNREEAPHGSGSTGAETTVERGARCRTPRSGALCNVVAWACVAGVVLCAWLLGLGE